MKRFICIICFLSSLCSCSPLDDDLSDDMADDLTNQLEWSGDIERFTLDNKGLRLCDKDGAGGSAFLVTPSLHVRGTRWEFRVHLFFNPSVNNYARFYLAASTSNLSEPLNGYFLQIGGSKDQISLYRQEGVRTVLLAAGRELMKDNNSPELAVKVECDEKGYWTFWTCLKEETDYVKEQLVRDETFDTSAYAGVLCFYTVSRRNGFLFSQVRITEDVVETTTPSEEPDLPEEPEHPDHPAEIPRTLLFNEVMYDCAKDGGEYVELYNHSSETLSCSSLRLGKQREDGSYMSKTILYNGSTVGSKIPPGGYICFTKDAATLRKKHPNKKAILVEISNFPALSNIGGILVLLSTNGNKEEEVMDRCHFLNAMHVTGKRAVGVSLEKRSPGLASDKSANWISSADKTGGTPGVSNSIWDNLSVGLMETNLR